MEAFASVLPIAGIVLLASVALVPIPSGTMLMFLAGCALLILGMGFFTLGAEMAMTPMGEGFGVQLTRSSNIFMIIVVGFVIGMVITIAEPDLDVLSHQVPGIPPETLTYTVGAGVGVFLVLAILRSVLKIPLNVLLVTFYVITFAVVFSPFTPDSFVPVAFDSGGVTTGPVSVPFILALGVGVASLRADKGSSDDSFGLVAMCSIGPILAVLILGAFFQPSGADVAANTVTDAPDTRIAALHFAHDLPISTKEVASSLAALVGLFIIFQLITRRYRLHQLRRIVMGFVYTFIGLVVFLTGVNTGFIPVGHLLGLKMASSPELKWGLVPFGMVVGYFIVRAEPAVHVLNKQVEEITAGAIPEKTMFRCLAVGMAGALGVTITRILLGIPILYILVPGYAVAILLTFFVPKIFTGIAFDSGGVCSGAMTSTFLLPLAMGVTQAIGGDMMKDAFGIVAMVAMAPLVVIQLLGLVFSIKTKRASRRGKAEPDRDSGKIYVWPEEFYVAA
jgi:hypothetical protein